MVQTNGILEHKQSVKNIYSVIFIDVTTQGIADVCCPK